MGTSYDGVYFYGVVFDEFGEDDEPEGWPAVTRAVLEEADDEDFDAWLDHHLGVPSYTTFAGYDLYRAERERRCVEVFGVSGFRKGYLGLIDYSVDCVAPVDAWVMKWRGARCPEFTAEQVATWRVALDRLRAVLPGAGAPGFHFGCSVG